MNTDTIESGRLTHASGTWSNGSGTFTWGDNGEIAKWWDGSGDWSQGKWWVSNGEFSLTGANWTGSGKYRIAGTSEEVDWTGSGEAWSGSGTIGSPMKGHGTFRGYINEVRVTGSWNADITKSQPCEECPGDASETPASGRVSRDTAES